MGDWTKSGSPPGPLPREDVDPQGRVWSNLANNPQGRTACGWVRAPSKPTPDDGEIVVWTDGAWAVVAAPPPSSSQMRIEKYWLFQRFSVEQERAFAKLEHQARNLSPADLDDPAKEGLFQLQRFLRRLDALTVIELDAAQTLGGFELLRLLGVFGDPQSEGSSDALAPILAAPAPHEAA